MTIKPYQLALLICFLINGTTFSSRAQHRRLGPEKWDWHPTGELYGFSTNLQKPLNGSMGKVFNNFRQHLALIPAKGFDIGILASMDINPLLENAPAIRNKFYEEPLIIDTLRGFPLYAGEFLVINKTKETNLLGVKKEKDLHYEIAIKKKELEHKKEVHRRFTLPALLNIHLPAKRTGNDSGKPGKSWIMKI